MRREPITVASYFRYPREYGIEGRYKYELLYSHAYAGVIGMLWFSSDCYLSHRLSDHYIINRNLTIADVEAAFRHHFLFRLKECKDTFKKAQDRG